MRIGQVMRHVVRVQFLVLIEISQKAIPGPLIGTDDSRQLIVIESVSPHPQRLIEGAGTAEHLSTWKGIFEAVRMFLWLQSASIALLSSNKYLRNALQGPVIIWDIELLDVERGHIDKGIFQLVSARLKYANFESIILRKAY